jgi:zinc transport system permease protein
MNEFLALLNLPFMQRAIAAALISGLLCPAVGTYIVQRRLSLLGDGLGHVATAGVGLALLTGTAPLPVAVVVCLVGAIGIELLRQTGKTSADIGLAILFYGGLAGGVLLASLSGQGAGVLSQYLFGSLTTVSDSDIWLIGVLAVFVIIFGIGLMPQLFSVCADEEYARTQGLPVRALNILIVAMAAITVTMSMRTVGLLLVSALMVVPVATTQNLVNGFRATLFGAMVLGAVVGGGGTIASAWIDTATGPTIVIAAIAFFVISIPLAGLLRRRAVARKQTDDAGLPPSHPHVPAEPHAPDHDHTGETVILHGDHVDYVHGGHRHAPHGDHYDEH